MVAPGYFWLRCVSSCLIWHCRFKGWLCAGFTGQFVTDILKQMSLTCFSISSSEMEIVYLSVKVRSRETGVGTGAVFFCLFDSCYVLWYHMFRSSAHTYNLVIKFKVKITFYTIVEAVGFLSWFCLAWSLSQEDLIRIIQFIIHSLSPKYICSFSTFTFHAQLSWN